MVDELIYTVHGKYDIVTIQLNEMNEQLNNGKYDKKKEQIKQNE